MNGFVEMFRACLMHVCLSALAVILSAIAARAFWKSSREGFARLADALRGMPLIVRMMAVVVLGNFIVYGSTKAPGGGSDGADGDDDGGAPMYLSLDDEDPTGPAGTGFTAEDVARGFVLVGTGTGETWDFSKPEGAASVRNWELRGASEDVARLGPGCAVLSDGRIAAGGRLFSPLHTLLGIVPEANWDMLPEGAGASRVWFGGTGAASMSVVWENVLPGRDPALVASFGAEFFRDGRIVFKYGDIPAEVMTNAVIGVSSPSLGLEVAGTPGLTSVRLHAVEPEDLTVVDRDGDGIPTWDEVRLYGTDPDADDSDGDGIPDGEEIAQGGDPLARSVTDSEILARVARQAADTAFGAETWTVEGELAARALWGGFAADVAIGGDAATNVVYERIVPIDPRGGWTRYFLSSRPTEAHGWWLEGLRLEWSDDAGGAGSVAESPLRDSLQLPVTPGAAALTLRLVTTDAHVRSSQPLWLLAYTPRFEVTGGKAVPLADGTTAYVFTDAREAAGAIRIDRAARPSRSALGADELGETACAVPEGTGVWPVRPWERTADSAGMGRAAVQWGDRIVVLDPTMTYGVSHEAVGNPGFPYDTAWLLGGWWRTSEGAWRCGCSPEIAWGGVTDEHITTAITADDGLRAEGVLRYAGVDVWTGSAEHRIMGSREERVWICTCPSGCPHCRCKRPDGVSHGSVRFRLALGETVSDQVAGFVWFASDGPVSVGTGTFSVTGRPDATVTDVSSESSRQISASGALGRTVSISAVTNGVSVSVSVPGGEATDRVWLIENVNGDPSVLRFVESGAEQTVLFDETWSCSEGDEPGSWIWDAVDNLAVPEPEPMPDIVTLEGTNYVFDAVGRLASLGVAEGGVTNVVRTFTYDGEGRLVLVEDADGGSLSFAYDEDGRIVAPADDEDEDGGIMLLSDEGEPVPHHITVAEAREHRRTGHGAPLAMPFEDVATENVSPTDFPAMREFFKTCHAPGDYPISGNLLFKPRGNIRLLLGDITLRLEGTNTVSEGCTWNFSGRLTCHDDTYDMNAACRGSGGEFLTRLGRIGRGTDFDIRIVGEKPMTARGGCGGHIGN